MKIDRAANGSEQIELLELNADGGQAGIGRTVLNDWAQPWSGWRHTATYLEGT